MLCRSKLEQQVKQLGVQAPVLLRLAFHDAGTYSAAEANGGPNGSIRFELQRPENQGAPMRAAQHEQLLSL